jgi:hypothetical protein
MRQDDEDRPITEQIDVGQQAKARQQQDDADGDEYLGSSSGHVRRIMTSS